MFSESINSLRVSLQQNATSLSYFSLFKKSTETTKPFNPVINPLMATS